MNMDKKYLTVAVLAAKEAGEIFKKNFGKPGIQYLSQGCARQKV